MSEWPCVMIIHLTRKHKNAAYMQQLQKTELRTVHENADVSSKLALDEIFLPQLCAGLNGGKE